MQIIHIKGWGVQSWWTETKYPCTQQIRDLYCIGVRMCKGFKFGSEVSCKQNKFEQKIHSKWKMWMLNFEQKVSTYAEYSMPMMLYCLLLTVFDLFWSFKNRETLTTHIFAWLSHTLLSHVKTLNAWSYYRYYRVLHYARVYFHRSLLPSAYIRLFCIRGCDSFKHTVPWCCHDDDVL